MRKLLILFFLCLFFTQSWAQSQCIEGDCINGQGTLMNAAGDKYIGEFRGGKRHGQGSYIDFAGSSRYSGEWEDDKKNGRGILRERDYVYVGEWKDDKREGQGIQQISMVTIVGDRDGDPRLASLMKPEGTMPFREDNRPNQSRYSDLLAGLRCLEYEGQWKNDKKDGQGLFKAYVYTYESGRGCLFLPYLGLSSTLVTLLGFRFEDVNEGVLVGLSRYGTGYTPRPDSQRSGLRSGDIILEVGGFEIRDSSDLLFHIIQTFGMEPEIRIRRLGGVQPHTVPTLNEGAIPVIRYEGQFNEGAYNGRGTYTEYIGGYGPFSRQNATEVDPQTYEVRNVAGRKASEWEYNGDFLNGAFNGKGTLVYNSGDIYSGDWLNGHRHGQGTYTYTDGYTYGGEWEQGRYFLDGQYIDDFREFARQEAEAARQEAEIARQEAEAARQEVEIARQRAVEAEQRYLLQKADGRCIEGDCTNGQGTFVYSNGRTIVGEWKNGKRHGSVTMSYPNGSSYTSRWWNGNWCGEALSC